MTKGEQRKPIDRVFCEMKAKGLVAEKRRLVEKSAKWDGNFKAGILHWNTVYYNVKYSSLDDDLLRFTLLHEENHKTSSQNWKLLFGFITAGFVALACTHLYEEQPNQAALNLACVVMFFLAMMSVRAFQTPLREDETRADLHAARVMIERLGVRNPSAAAASLFTTIDKEQVHHKSLPYRALRFILGGVHPPDKERIRAIRELEESLVKGVDTETTA